MTVIELGNKLNEMYYGAPKSEMCAMIHLFGVLYADEIELSGATNSEIIKAAGLKESYYTELAKGRKLSKFVDTKSAYRQKYR